MILIRLLLLFFRIGLFSFGGGYAMLPLIYQGANELTGMTAEEFSRLVALSQVTPGPVAINAATYVGYQYAGIPGATAATVGVVLPSVLLVFIVSLFLVKFRESDAMKAVLSGNKAGNSRIASLCGRISCTRLYIDRNAALICCR